MKVLRVAAGAGFEAVGLIIFYYAYIDQVIQTGVADIVLSFIDQSALAALAAFAIWMLNMVWKDRLIAAERHATQMATMQQEAIEVIKNNTAVMTKLTERLREFEGM